MCVIIHNNSIKFIMVLQRNVCSQEIFLTVSFLDWCQLQTCQKSQFDPRTLLWLKIAILHSEKVKHVLLMHCAFSKINTIKIKLGVWHGYLIIIENIPRIFVLVNTCTSLKVKNKCLFTSCQLFFFCVLI